MCGRFAFFAHRKRLQEQFSLSHIPEEILSNYNITPGQDIAAVRKMKDGTRELVMLRWGLVPSWARDLKTGYRMINARAESVAEKPAFRNAFKLRRCLIPASGFYEWQKQGKDGKQPWFIRVKEGDIFAFAGLLWEHWESPDGEPVESCAIITVESNELVARIHDRMPVILHKEDYETWLSPSSTEARLTALLKTFPATEMEAWPVSSTVNNPANNSPHCIEPMHVQQAFF